MALTHCLSLLFHEAPEVIDNQIKNALHYLPNSNIVVHFGLEAALIKSQIKAIYKSNPRVFFNDHCLPTAWGWILHAQLSNYKFAKRLGIPFDFYIMDSSNSLIFRRGMEEYLSSADADYCLNPVDLHSHAFNEHWVKLHAFGNDPCFINLLNDLRCSAPRYCRHEGTAFKADLLEEMVRIISKHYIPKIDEIFYPREEIYWATTAHHLSKNSRDVMTITADLTPQIIDDVRCSNIEGLRTFEPWKNTSLEYFRNKFAVKPVPRTMTNPLRKYISDLMLLND